MDVFSKAPQKTLKRDKEWMAARERQRARKSHKDSVDSRWPRLDKASAWSLTDEKLVRCYHEAQVKSQKIENEFPEAYRDVSTGKTLVMYAWRLEFRSLDLCKKTTVAATAKDEGIGGEPGRRNSQLVSSMFSDRPWKK